MLRRTGSMWVAALASTSLWLAAAAAVGDNWPDWRGPEGTFESSEKNLPLHWSRDENVHWKVKLPERGNSTPIIWQDRVFVTQPIEKENRRTLLCFDRATGNQLWQVGTTYDAKEPTHQTNPYCSASPVTDGSRVIAWFGSAGVFCYDFQGRQLWSRDLGVQEHEWGYAASPVLHGDLCFVSFGPGKRELVAALDKKTGQVVWSYDVPKPPAPGPEAKPAPGDDLRGSFTTPLVIRTQGRDELIVTLPERVVAFEPRTGRILWTCDGLGSLVYSSPIWGEGVLVALGGYHRACLAVRPGGSGDVTASHRIWHQPKSRLRLGTGVIRQGRIFINDMQGIVECQDLATGKTLWEERLKATAGDNATWSSLVLTADDRIYMLNQAGDTFIFKAGPKFELLATNSLGEMTNATTAIADGQIFIRTDEHLWCIGKPAR